MRQARPGTVSEQRVVEHIAHAVQALELEALGVAGRSSNGRDGQRVVGGELRVTARPRGEKRSAQATIVEVGHRLAGEHRIIGKPALLRALDLGVPIGALDEPHHQPPVEPVGEIADPVDHRRRALLVGLDGEAEAVPAGERRIGEQRRRSRPAKAPAGRPPRRRR